MEDNAQNTDPSILSLFLWKHIVPGWDSKTNEVTHVTIEALFLRSSFPGCCPIVAIQRIIEMHGKSKMSFVFTPTLNHMNEVLGKNSMQTAELFNTDKAGAAELMTEPKMIDPFQILCRSINCDCKPWRPTV
jgi:hypothetical protein